MYRNKGFTLIELMIVVWIICILAAIAIPQYVEFKAKSKAKELIDKGVSVTTVKNDDVKKAMIKMLAKTKEFVNEVNEAANNQLELQENSNNTVSPVSNPEPVPQSVNNTVQTVQIPNMVITCQDREMIIATCTLNINSGENRYLLPIRCERTNNIHEYKCEVF